MEKPVPVPDWGDLSGLKIILPKIEGRIKLSELLRDETVTIPKKESNE